MRVERESKTIRAAVGTAATDKASRLRIEHGLQESVLKSGLLVNYMILAAFFLLSLMLRLWLLDKRWINPDEGAHLMDALLTLQGYIPLVDFGSRQPFYVFMNAIWLKLFGVNYLAGRLFPLTCSLFTGLLVYLIARKLFNEKVALLSAVIYLLIPFEVLNSVLVKTEPLANLIACASILLLLKYGDDRNNKFLFLSGALAAVGYYVRQSAITLPIAAGIYIVLFKRQRFPEASRSLGTYFIGYGLVVLAFMIFYSQFFSVDKLLFGIIDPAGFILSAGRKLWNLVSQNVLTAGSENVDELVGTMTTNSLYYIKLTIYLHTFLFLGVLWAAIRSFYYPGSNSPYLKLPSKSYLFAILWTGLLTFAYVYYYKVFGYYIDYFRELLPVLSILFAAFVYETIFCGSSQRTLVFWVSLVLMGLATLFFVEKIVDVPKGVQIIFVIGSVAILMISGERLTRRVHLAAVFAVAGLALFYLFGRAFGWTPKNVMLGFTACGISLAAILSVRNRIRFIGISFVLCVLVLNTYFASSIMGLNFDTIWSPSAVRKITNVIEENSSKDDEVLSGAVIWEFNSHRRPFEMISHPLVYRHNMSDEVAEKIESRMTENPPKIVVLDGYTEMIYLNKLDWMTRLLQRKYNLILTDKMGKYPVCVYKLSVDG